MYKKQIKVRRNRGSAINVLAVITLPMCLAIGALSVDFGHGVLVRAQLQSACDAAALAGAKDLVGDVGPLTALQISTAQSDAKTVGNANLADQKPVSVIVDNPPPMYNVPPYSTAVPQYVVTASATTSISNIFARLFGISGEPISATSRAGVFPSSTSTALYGSLASTTAPIAVTIDVNANNDLDAGAALSSIKKGQGFKIQTNGATGGGQQNAAWIELQQGSNSSPLSPLASSIPLTDQLSSQGTPGIFETGNTPYASLSGGANNSSTNGNQGWTPYIVSQIVANAGSFNITVPIITDPTGNTDPSSLKAHSQMQIVGVATFNITQTARGPGQKLQGDATFYGTLVNALPLNAAEAANFLTFFSQFQSGNSGGTGNSSQGTPQVRLF
ncbi:MAG: pilus assembly protein TadG-related protein [Candidatus Obscuribacterales bacterium]|nr:pilus assembly protein TadG-related protein [Candidatus Obscuribacterales bacterium]